MSEYGKVIIEQTDLVGVTKGLDEYGCPDIKISVDDETLREEIRPFLLYLVRYVIEGGIKINSNETMPYGYWLVRFRALTESLLEVWEYNKSATEFVRGGNLTLRYFKEQFAMCRKYKSEFMPPRPDKKVAVSEGVLEGDLVEGVRYVAPEHMSGWYITTDRYNGDFRTLKVIHLYCLSDARPDLVSYFALSPGFRFCQIGNKNEVWFDKDVLK